jgi:hypothetical protein
MLASHAYLIHRVSGERPSGEEANLCHGGITLQPVANASAAGATRPSLPARVSPRSFWGAQLVGTARCCSPSYDDFAAAR